LQGLFTYHLHDKLRLKLLSMYSDLRYATPGGLTEAQADTDPRMARPKAGPVPSAETQRAAIYNRYGYVGLAYEVDLSKRLQHTTSLFGNTSDFRNPFITNYEVRDEKSIGLRTTIKWSAPTDASYRWQWYSGLEWQKTYSEVDNYGNRFGNKDTLQVSDGIRALQHFYFTRCILYPSARWTLEAALSLNFYSFQYKTYAPRPEAPWHVRRFQGELMPKWALAYTMTRHTVLRASLSRGFSPPTLAELRPSDNQFYTGLRAESGWNYELGLRMRNTSRRASLDAAFFYFVLNNTIVRQTNSNGAEYFVNAGRTSQPGMEVQVTFQLIKERQAGLLRNLELRTSYTGYKFTFSDYISNKTVYSGKRLTGIPAHTCVTGLSAYFSKFYVFLQHNFTSKIPLNDANTVYANSYHLIQAKVNYTLDLSKVYRMSVYLGMDNLMNVRYSLGNDLNAFGGRYYNPAPLRNVYVGIMLSF
ncbi:MAG TPA: TonB-dependent receptor, partial [Cytophagales bacterium]|nr:TonB-dependent receptor [Cytophagales bacterium]